jgi:hypothetical protein
MKHRIVLLIATSAGTVTRDQFRACTGRARTACRG